MTILSILASWLCLSILLLGAWIGYCEIQRAHQRALTRVYRATPPDPALQREAP